jgi:N-glycosylase/DNA lyase
MNVFTIPTPPGFNFWRTVFSHGWCALPPFSHNPKERTLSRIFALRGGDLVSVTLSGSDGVMTGRCEGPAPGNKEAEEELRAQVASCLRLTEDLTPFYQAARRYSRYRWIPGSGAGRLLRAPTMFEDAVKMICTTNCTWELTMLMVSNLVRSVGKKFDAARSAFPSPGAIAGLTERFLRREVKSGYRSPFLLEFAERVAGGNIDPESWRSSPLTTHDLFKEMRQVKGIGPYAAGNLLKLAGRYDELGLDSWVRGRYYELRRKGRRVKDVTIERDYREFGEWRGLFLWLEMTREWHNDKFRL